MLFYVLVIVQLVQLPALQRRLAPLAAAGRMPLTNYLMQTLIHRALLRLGPWPVRPVGPAWQLLVAFAIYFVIQVPLATIWLRRFEYGPLEYLWRRGTYSRAAARIAPAPVG